MANYGTYGAISSKTKPKYGIFYTNLTGSLYLSSSDMSNTIIVTNSNGNKIYLPDTSQLIGITRQIFIHNNNSTNISLDIYDTLNNFLFTIAPHSQGLLWCVDVSTTQGTWSCGNTKFTISTGAISTGISNFANYKIYALTETSAFITGYASSVSWGAIITIDPSTLAITLSALQSCGFDNRIASQATAAVINSTKLIVVSGSSGGTAAAILNTNGTFTSYSYVLDAMVTQSAVVRLLTSTTAIIIHRGTSGYTYGRILTISGNTITAGTLYTLIATSDPDHVDIAISNSTTAVISYRNASTTIGVNVLTIAGDVISVGARYTVATDNTNYFAPTANICPLSPTTFIIYYKRYDNTGNSFANLITIAGSVVSVGTQCVVYNAHISTETAADGNALRTISPLNSSSALIVFKGANNYLYRGILKVSNTSLIVENMVLLSNTASNYLTSCYLSPKVSVLTYYVSAASYSIAIGFSNSTT